MNKKTILLPVFRYVVPADFEETMERYALDGWTVDKLHRYNSLFITLRKTEPKKYRYVFDLNIHPTTDYHRIYEQFGWEFVGQMSSCFIWRKEYADIRPESFTDSDSLVRRNMRVRNAVAAGMFAAIIGAIAGCVGLRFVIASGIAGDIASVSGLILFSAAFAAYLGWVVHTINKNRYR
ncbi:MAG: DUF2812 domain-containing protein [Oscillospiraceae bacterium]|jgi:hypothetical protein|nr:DUF2812 domain-containing protein [Oscillospiraceae bacterium]